MNEEGYLESCKTEFWGEVFEKEAEYISKELENYDNILSIGCGPAIVEKILQNNCFTITGLDISRETLKKSPEDIRKVVGSAEKMGFKDGSFEATIYVASLQFVDSYKKALEETVRILKTEGELLVMLLNPASKFFKSKRKKPNSYVNKIKHPELGQIEKAIKRRFDINKRDYYLGINGKEIFRSSNPNFAALYIIRGTKI